VVLVEGTLWPLVVVGVLPDSEEEVDVVTPISEERLWSTDVLRLALIVAGTGTRAKAAHDGVFGWLRRHRSALSRRTFRMAWIIEDDTMRACAEAWQALVGGRLFGAESTTFRAVGPALSWLLNDGCGNVVAPTSHDFSRSIAIRVSKEIHVQRPMFQGHRPSLDRSTPEVIQDPHGRVVPGAADDRSCGVSSRRT